MIQHSYLLLFTAAVSTFKVQAMPQMHLWRQAQQYSLSHEQKTQHFHISANWQGRLPLPLVPFCPQLTGLQSYFDSQAADQHDNFIGFVTRLEQGKDHKNIEQIDGLSRYGALLKIQKSDIVAGYSSYDHQKEYTVNYLGLTFARFRISSLKATDGKLMAQVELYNDGVSKQIEGVLQKKSLISNLKKELKVYYEFFSELIKDLNGMAQAVQDFLFTDDPYQAHCARFREQVTSFSKRFEDDFKHTLLEKAPVEPRTGSSKHHKGHSHNQQAHAQQKKQPALSSLSDGLEALFVLRGNQNNEAYLRSIGNMYAVGSEQGQDYVITLNPKNQQWRQLLSKQSH